MKPKDLPLFRNREAKRVLADACREQGVSIDLLQQLLEIERTYSGKGNSLGITAEFEAAIADFLDSKSASDVAGAA